jgi:phosphoribosylanthranilate isomerase
MPIELKICGINSESVIKTILQNGGCQYLGFVFYPPSPRNLSIKQSVSLTSKIPSKIKKVAILVKPENSFIEKIKNQFDYFQIYDSSPSEVKKFKLISNKKIIQAIKVKKKEDINSYKQYIGIADEFLFDSSGMEKSFLFDWSYLKKIDISSGLEDNPGNKSPKKIVDFLAKVKNYD